MNKEPGSHLNKALFVCFVFILFFNFMPRAWVVTGDFEFHFDKAGNNCFGQKCDTYYPLLHIVGSFFAFSEHAFFTFLLLLLLLVTPLIIFYMTRNWFSVFLYFSIQYVYVIQTGGAYPQALAGILLLLFLALKNKNPLFRGALLALSLMAHSQAFSLILLVWIAELFFEANVFCWIKGKAKFFLPACSAIFGKQAVDPIGQKALVEVVNISGTVNPINVTLKDVGNFFVRSFPFPFLIAAFWQVWKEKDYALIVVSVIALYYGIATGLANRIFLVIPLLLLPSLTRFYSGLSGWWKKGFIVLTLVIFALNFGTWILFKINCIAT